MISALRSVLSLFDRQTKQRLALALGGSVIVAAMEAVAVIAIIPLTDLLTKNTQSAGLTRLRDILGAQSDAQLAARVAGLVLLGFTLKGVIALAIRWWSQGFLLEQANRTSGQLLRYYLDAPYSLHLQRGAPDLLRTLNDGVATLYSSVVIPGMSALTELITITVLGLSLLFIAPLPALTVTVYLGTAALLLQRMGRRRLRRAGEGLVQGYFRQTQAALHALGGIKEISLRQEGETFVREFVSARRITSRAVRVTTFWADVPKYVMEMLFILGIGLMTAVVYATDSTGRALGMIALFGVAGFRLLPSIVRMLASVGMVRSGLPSLELVQTDLRDAAVLPPKAASTERMHFRHEVRLEGVSFRYDGTGRDVLSDISLVIEKGTSLALVGGSGAGKTTLVDIILGFHRPTTGRLTVDGEDVQDRLSAWQRNLAMVPQDVYLLDGSVRDNIRFSPDAIDPEDERVNRAIDQAQLRTFVADLPAGLSTTVGDRGARLSGGQRQRIGIARALFASPELLVLDEATSALDNETEKEITDTIESLSGSMAVIVVAHRLSTVRHCDRVALMDNGRIVDIGTFSELRDRSPQFAHLVALGSLEG